MRLLALETMSLFSWLEHLVFTVFVICIVNIWYSEGLQGVLSVIIKVSRSDVDFSIEHVDSSLFHFRRKFFTRFVYFQTLKRGIPGFSALLHQILSGEVKNFTKQIQKNSNGGGKNAKVSIPEKGNKTTDDDVTGNNNNITYIW